MGRRTPVFLRNLRLNQKIQLLLLALLVPLLALFMLLFLSMDGYNNQYDRIIANASRAAGFSINFKEEYDYKIYLIIAGHSSFEKEAPFESIDNAKVIAASLIDNASGRENRDRAVTIMNLLDNLEKDTLRIQANREEGGHYDDNISIWENYIQRVTSMIRDAMLEYSFYENQGMDALRRTINQQLNQLRLVGLMMFAILAFIALLMSILIPNGIVRPVHHLIDVTKRVAAGDLTARASVREGTEMPQLAMSMNSMIGRIESLVETVRVDGEQLRMAELELLSSQINPHFLYNTLDTIIWLAESNQQDKVKQMVVALSDFFRTSLNHGNGIVHLSEEIRHVRSYLQIQQVRYQDILSYDINIPPELLHVTLPKLTLQPLVENALYHGIKSRRGLGRVTISGEIRARSTYSPGGAPGRPQMASQLPENDVILTVADDGVGMDEQSLQRVRQSFMRRTLFKENSFSGSYGLYNVDSRLRLKFGDQYGLSVDSRQGEGTTVKVRIPLTKPEDPADDENINAVQTVKAILCDGDHRHAKENKT